MWMYGSSSAYTRWPAFCLVDAAVAIASAMTSSAIAARIGHRWLRWEVRIRLTNIYVDLRPFNEHANNSAPSDHSSVRAALDAVVQSRARSIVRLSAIPLPFIE